MPTKMKRKRLLVRFGVQMVFAAAVALASLIFLLSPTTSAKQLGNSFEGTQSHGRITISLRTFDPAAFDLDDYNDRAARQTR